MDMKSADMYEDYEKLLISKDYDQLNDEEKTFVHSFCDGSEGYFTMKQVLLQSRSFAEESNAMTPPTGGADQVFNRFLEQQKTGKHVAFYNRKTSVLWVAGLAAALIFSWLIRFPVKQKADPMLIPDVTPRLITEVKTDTVIKAVPVYIQHETRIDTHLPESSNEVVSYGGMVYVQPVSSVGENKEQRQGTNASEMGDLAKLAVTMN